MRARHAIVPGDGTVLLNGNTYKVLPRCARELKMELDGRYIYATSPDVPVLLSRRFDLFWMQSLGDGLILRYYGTEDTLYYCREDRYDEFVKAIEDNAPIAKYYYTYYSPVIEDFEDYFLTDDQGEMFETVLQSGEILNEYEMGIVSARSLRTLYGLSEDGWFYEAVCGIECAGNTYYLTLGSNGKRLRVPEEYNSFIAEIAEGSNTKVEVTADAV